MDAAAAKPNAGTTYPALYFHPLGRECFTEASLGFPIRLRVFSSVDLLRFMDQYARGRLFGRLLMGVVYLVEGCFPRTFGQVGQYPVFLIDKKQV